jgi:hypothetical protein
MISGAINPAQLVANLINSQEYRLKFDTPDNIEFVRLLYRNILLREPLSSEVSFQAAALSAGCRDSSLGLTS